MRLLSRKRVRIRVPGRMEEYLGQFVRGWVDISVHVSAARSQYQEYSWLYRGYKDARIFPIVWLSSYFPSQFPYRRTQKAALIQWSLRSFINVTYSPGIGKARRWMSSKERPLTLRENRIWMHNSSKEQSTQKHRKVSAGSDIWCHSPVTISPYV